MAASGPQLRAIIEVGCLTALRKSDLLRLTLAAHSIGETTETYVRARDKVIVAPTR
ncbi:hypothetical protein LRF89_07315 [Halorhodospira sp. 9621]|uniref:hypothetical protein n=1 Tax=Halorhodospira TaxID=85108 RepID=UPI001EE886C6|nr:MULTISPECIES: hypothetical protein [Halorhodospira]MCG5527920.1 hypothetical protein [Halorhodospira halophila]MCG5533248.1 hypothetical protein [Halorhodospira sp. 9621]MCG5542210.1 hypothetical protein [Halorhodospira sp. 9628]